MVLAGIAAVLLSYRGVVVYVVVLARRRSRGRQGRRAQVVLPRRRTGLRTRTHRSRHTRLVSRLIPCCFFLSPKTRKTTHFAETNHKKLAETPSQPAVENDTISDVDNTLLPLIVVLLAALANTASNGAVAEITEKLGGAK